MLDAYIIDAIKERERERELEEDRRLHLELPRIAPTRPREEEAETWDSIVIPLNRDDQPEEDAA